MARAAGLAAAAGAAAVMSGISEALVATAVGLAVAIPAVVAFNSFNRWLKTILATTTELSHAISAFAKSKHHSTQASAPQAVAAPSAQASSPAVSAA